MTISRRQAIRTGLGALAAASIPGCAATATRNHGANGKTSKARRPKMWAWMSRSRLTRIDELEERFANLRSIGVEAVLANVFDGSRAWYGSTNLPVAEPVLEKALPIAKATGIELHAWIVSLRCNVKPVQVEHPEWFTISRNGESSLIRPPYIEEYNWLCPTRPEVVEFVGRTVGELAAYSELAGVHHDYIRYCDTILPIDLQPTYNLKQDRIFPQFDFCYCDVCRETFRKQHGVDPLKLEDPSANDAWNRFRCDTVTHLVNSMKPAGDKLYSAAVFPQPSHAYYDVRQDWPNWNLDAVFPMIYHPYYRKTIAWVEDVSREGTEAVAGRFPLYAGVMASAIKPEEVAQTIEYATKGGAAGVCWFTANDMRDQRGRALEQATRSMRSGARGDA